MSGIENVDSSNEYKAQLMRRATYASVAVAFTLIIIKFIAYVLTGSVAVLSSLVDSVLDAFASVVNLFAVRHALTPADEEHRFGHGKAEPLAGLAQAAFITGSSLFLVFEAINRMVNPLQIQHSIVGIIVIVISLVFTILLVMFQKHVVRQTQSIAVHADSIHYLSDVAMNLSVIAALILSTYFGWLIADPVFALGIAAYIVYSAWQIASHSLNQLMDRELPDVDRHRIMKIAMQHPAVKSLHELRTRASGKDVFIQLHLVMDGAIALLKAHTIADEVERELREAFPNADVIIHEDPEGLEE
ncbi:MAG: cation diffusion facilitator family transporter [Gammaproteobacteria bacterium]|nr:cation diffusion facilitator family transporter [Gammaproteobacteria bacterium]